MKFFKYYLFLIFIVFLILSPKAIGIPAKEIRFIEIGLNKNIAIPNAEFSGMDWYNDKLILLPQYPDRFPSKFNGCFYSISKTKITNYLKAKERNPLNPIKIELDSKGIEENIKGFQGYEAIAFNNESVYLTIEAENSGQMSAYIIIGKIDTAGIKITLIPESLKGIPVPVNLENMAFETLTIYEDKIIVIYEANGKNVNDQPHAVSFDLELQTYEILTFPNIEYRITDATRIEKNSFWAINYLFKGERELLNPEVNELSFKNDRDTLNSKNWTVERLVKFEIVKNQVILKDEVPVHFKLSEDGESRNWEGIVKYDSLGFLLITDKFPRTILAYIPYSFGINDLFIFEKAGKYGFKNSLNVEIINGRFNFAQKFSKYGIAAVVDDSGWVYINKNGKKIIRPHVIDNGPDYFSFGLARFISNNKFGYFNEEGSVIIKPQFDYARSFADSMAAVCIGCQFVKRKEHTEIINGRWGFINLKGELNIPYIYDEVGDFNNGHANVKENEKSTIINRIK